MKHLYYFNEFLIENKVYGKNIINQIIKKIGEDEDIKII